MMPRLGSPAFLAPLLMIAATSALPYVRFQTTNGSPFHRTDSTQISIRLNASVSAGMANSAGAVWITAGSDPAGAVQAALKTWSGVPGSAVRFAPLTTTGSLNDSSDGENVIVFRDTPEIRSVVGSALAVTLNMVLADGTIVDSDTMFNPAYTFSTNLARGTYDLQAVETHELGHVLGANHSTVLDATMFQSQASGDNIEAHLSPDDLAFSTGAYPSVASSVNGGRIWGHVRLNGAGVSGASVVAIDPASGVVVGALSSSDGSFAISPLPPGFYMVYAEPLNGPVLAANLYLPISAVNTAFSTTFLGGSAPRMVKVTDGGAVSLDLTVQPACSLRIDGLGVGSTGGSGDFTAFGTGPIRLDSAQSVDLMLVGPGVDQSLANGSVELIGPGLNIRAGSLRIDPGLELNGMPMLRMTVDIAPRATPASATVLVTKGADAATYTAALLLTPARPRFTSDGLVNAASFHASGVTPGEITSLFGSGLGPTTGVSTSGFDPSTGLLPTRLGAVTVTFDGIPAPLFYVSANQINLDVPYEIAGKSSTTVVVTNAGVPSAGVEVPVVAAAPGLFTFSGSSQVVALNQDGSVNSLSSPTPRGSVVTLFATGQGAVTPPVATGQPAPSSPLATASATIVTIGGKSAKVYFAGLTPGMVGLMQINAEIPSSISPGSSVPVQVTVKGIAAAGTTTIAIQ